MVVAAIHMPRKVGVVTAIPVTIMLISVIQENDPQTLQDLLKDGGSPLMRAAENGHLETVRMLLDHGANTDSGLFSTRLLQTLCLKGGVGRIQDKLGFRTQRHLALFWKPFCALAA